MVIYAQNKHEEERGADPGPDLGLELGLHPSLKQKNRMSVHTTPIKHRAKNTAAEARSFARPLSS
jgi:hypothetical protein